LIALIDPHSWLIRIVPTRHRNGNMYRDTIYEISDHDTIIRGNSTKVTLPCGRLDETLKAIAMPPDLGQARVSI
jgi:hypothetical protein